MKGVPLKIHWKGRQLEATRAVVRAGALDGEVVVVALEKNYRDHRSAHPDKVLYAWPELPIMRELLEVDPAGYRMVHALKKEFRGWITPKLCEGFGRPPAGGLAPGRATPFPGQPPAAPRPAPEVPPADPRRCAACGRPYSNSETERCLECEVLARATGGA